MRKALIRRPVWPSCWPPPPAAAQQTIKIGLIMPYSGPVRRHRRPDRQRHQALHEAARRHGRRQEDRIHPQGFRRHRAGRRQAPRAGTGGARQGRHPGGLRPHAERARGRRHLGRGEEVHGDHERRDLDHHHQVALHGAHLGDPAAAQRDARHLGGDKNGVKKAYTMVSDYGPGHDAEGAFHRGFKEAGGEIVGSVRFPVANPDFSAFVQRAKDVNPDGIYIWIPAARSRRRSPRRCPSAASTRRRSRSWGRAR